jgi:hypothetical protein
VRTLGKRVGETLKSSNLLSSARVPTRKIENERHPPYRSAGSPVLISVSITAWDRAWAAVFGHVYQGGPEVCDGTLQAGECLDAAVG